MTTNLRLNLSQFDTAELVWKINSSLLTLDAHQATLELLRDRGVDTKNLRQAPGEFNAGVPYGLRSAEDRLLGLNTLLNFLLVCMLPLTIAGLYYSLPSGRTWLPWLMNGLVFPVVIWILRSPYNQVFNRPDRLWFGLKVASYLLALAMSAYFFAEWLIEPLGWFYGCTLRGA